MKDTSTTRSSRARAASRERNLCQFRFSDGRRCRMLRHINHRQLCVFHARAEAQALETQRLGLELAQTMSCDFMSATDINFAMGRLYSAVAQERIPIRNANALTRIGRIMLATVPTVQWEFPFSYTFDEWNKMLDATDRFLQRRPPHPTLFPPSLTPPLAPPGRNRAKTRRQTNFAQRIAHHVIRKKKTNRVRRHAPGRRRRWDRTRRRIRRSGWWLDY